MSFIRTAVVLAASLLLAGCLPVTSKTPVGSTANLGADKALIGTWKGHSPDSNDKQDAFVHFMQAKDGGMTIALVYAHGTNDDGWTIFNAKSATLGKNHFLNAVETFDKDAATADRLQNANIPMLYTVKGRTLTIYLLDEDKTKAAIKAGKLNGTITNGDAGDVTLTSDAAELDAFMASPEATDLFKVLLVLRRVD